ncbi:MAG TPA: ATP-binding cassette domain-containing protein [Planctomycetaceae bacterium]|jgi:ABC-type multidrug transport system ATPase subunit|nr:ATP-binding cassette domain-containing protein [Planctomycetaceae bacterium]
MADITAELDCLQDGKSVEIGSTTGSRRARILRKGSTLWIRDLDSQAGTFVNDVEVRGLVAIRSGDRVRLGDYAFRIPAADGGTANSSKASPNASRGFDLTVSDAVKNISSGQVDRLLGGKPRTILDHVSVRVEPGTFLGILGASGSGKSTLIKALAGITDLSEGQILINGSAASSQILRSDRRIAYLPQDVIIHEALTCAMALDYIARLKSLGGTAEARQQLIAGVLDRVGLAGQMDVTIQRLSGGQRKRVALAAELLGDPQVILLDEATSGLDPATEEDMMRLFHSLAAEGRTVVCITHFPGQLHLCDRLLYLMQGRCVFDGAPQELMQFFAVNSIEGVYTKEREFPAEEWLSRFRNSPVGRKLAAVSVATSARPTSDGHFQPLSREAFLQQVWDLTSRYFRLQLADWKNLLLLLAQAPVIALMIVATYGSISSSFAQLQAANTKEVIFLLVISTLWCSGTASVREVVKETPILLHETRFGVALLPYLFSKLSFLGLLSLLQTLSLLMTVCWLTNLSGKSDKQLLVLTATALVGVSLGLAISAIARTSERAMTLLPVVLIGLAIFSGGLARLNGVVRLLAMLFSPAYWSLDGIRSTLSSQLWNATYPGPPGEGQPPILGLGGPLLLDLLALFLQAVALTGIAWFALRLAIGGANGSPASQASAMFKALFGRG